MSADIQSSRPTDVFIRLHDWGDTASRKTDCSSAFTPLSAIWSPRCWRIQHVLNTHSWSQHASKRLLREYLVLQKYGGRAIARRLFIVWRDCSMAARSICSFRSCTRRGESATGIRDKIGLEPQSNHAGSFRDPANFSGVWVPLLKLRLGCPRRSALSVRRSHVPLSKGAASLPNVVTYQHVGDKARKYRGDDPPHHFLPVFLGRVPPAPNIFTSSSEGDRS
jgi:hypothetical protein